MTGPTIRLAAPRRLGRVNWLGAYTLFRREMARVLKEWPETLLAPAFSCGVYLTVFALAIGPDRSTPEGLEAFRFIVPGIVMMFVLALVSLETSIFSLQFDKLDNIVSDWLMPPLSGSEMAAAFVVSSMLAAVIAALPAVVLAVVVFDVAIQHPFALALATVLAATGFALVGIITGIWSERWDHSAGVIAFAVVPVLVVSGTFVPLDRLPEGAVWVQQFNPVFHAVDGFRYGWTGQGALPPAVSLTVVAATNLALWLVVDRLFRRGWRLRN